MKAKKFSDSNLRVSAAPVSAPDTTACPAPTHDQVAALAHAIWIDRGRPEGMDLDHWLEAERQLCGEVRVPATADEIPADDDALDPQHAITGEIERELDQIASRPAQRSPTSL